MNLSETRLLGQIERGSFGVSSLEIDIRVPKDHKRDYLGMSSIGKNTCNLWVRFHKPSWYKPQVITGQLERIFRLGKVLEEEIKTYITIGGGKIRGSQIEMSDFDGRFKGHNDGVWEDSHVLEVKTMNEDMFLLFAGSDIKASFYEYWCQVQMYMHYLDMSKAMIVAYGKNKSQIYCKEVMYNKEGAKYLRMKAYAIICTKTPCMIPVAFRDTDSCEICEWRVHCRGESGHFLV